MPSVPAREKRSHISLGLRPASLAPLRQILPDRLILDLLTTSGHTWRDRIDTPLVVFWGMVAQALDDDHTCSNTVARVIQWLRARKAPGQRRNRRVPKASTDTGSWWRARARLPLELFPAMVRRLARDFISLVPAADKLRGKDIFLVDGTTVSMPDTPELVKEFGKHLGRSKDKYPLMRISRAEAVIAMGQGRITWM